MAYNAIYTMALLGVLMTAPAQADWQDTFSRDNWNEVVGKVKGVIDLAPNTEEPSKIDKSQHLKEIWPDVLEQLDDALVLNGKIDNAVESHWVLADKTSLSEDQDDVFKEVEALLFNPAIKRNRETILTLKDKVAKEKATIAGYREKRVVASADEAADYDKKINQSKSSIADFSQRIDKEKTALKDNLAASGLLLSRSQIEVLLSRVDADDIINMSLVYDVLADITAQLMGLMKESNENIAQARKYYGMHVVLLKLVVNMQGRYMETLNTRYLPKIAEIKQKTVAIKQETANLLSRERNQARQKLLRKNIQAQDLTLKVANLYAEKLRQQRAKVKKARDLVLADYAVAKNTYDTVKVSADLLDLMKTSQASFDALMNIQIPDIVAFENIEMQRKFEEVSLLIK